MGTDELAASRALFDGVTIRRAHPSDTDALVEFNASLALETEGRQLDRTRLRAGVIALLERDDYGFYVIAEAQQSHPVVVAQVLITYEWSDWRNGIFWWMQSVYVHPQWRRRGVFRRLHHAVRQQARDRGDGCGLRLYVEQDNDVAQRVYENLGLARAPYRVFEEDFVLPLGSAECRGGPSR